MFKINSIKGLCHLTSIKHVAPSPSHAMDFARPCITFMEGISQHRNLTGKQYLLRGAKTKVQKCVTEDNIKLILVCHM